MQRWAQIQDGHAHWIFEAETPPQAHPSILFVDVTDHAPAVQEGWRLVGDHFEPPPAVDLTSDVSAPLLPAIATYLLTANKPLARHSHTEMHYGVVVVGTVRVVIGAREQVVTAPGMLELPAVIEHEAHAVTEMAVFLSVFPGRFGKVVQ